MLHRFLHLALAGASLLFLADSAEAGRRGGGCGGGRGGCGGGRGGCGGGYVGGCGGGGCGGGFAGGCGGGGMAVGAPIYGPGYGGPGHGGGRGRGTHGGHRSAASAPANLLVTLPSDARLFVDGQATTSTSGQRRLITPDLQPGRDYHYTLRAEVVRNGEVQRVSQRVTVRAGEDTPVNIQISTGVASR
jgi:uncharacterized protein (TIGR03000 family)